MRQGRGVCPLSLAPLARHPPFVAYATSPSGRRESFPKGEPLAGRSAGALRENSGPCSRTKKNLILLRSAMALYKIDEPEPDDVLPADEVILLREGIAAAGRAAEARVKHAPPVLSLCLTYFNTECFIHSCWKGHVPIRLFWKFTIRYFRSHRICVTFFPDKTLRHHFNVHQMTLCPFFRFFCRFAVWYFSLHIF